MKVMLDNVASLNGELENAIRSFHDHHAEMRRQQQYFKYSAFYERQAGDPRLKDNFFANLLRVFAEKNMEYTSPFPKVQVPVGGSTPDARQAASIREKILLGTWRKSGGALLQKRWARDGTLKSQAIAETVFDLRKRCVVVRRFDPRKCFWQLSNDNDPRVVAFWAVFAVTKDEAIKSYGVIPDSDPIADVLRNHPTFSKIDGKTWYTMAIRWDDKTRVAWIGNKLIEEPHNHMMPHIPVDLCVPIEDDDEENIFGDFYLNPLIPLQAELNDTLLRRQRIVRRMSSPMVWARGIVGTKNAKELEEKMSKPGGGFLPLGREGQAGLLQLQDTGMLSEHQVDIILQMTRLAGYGNAAFGESVGANTSGDALAMYFNATQRKIEHQNISWVAFYESINAKILRLYETFLKPDETINITGFSPASTLEAISTNDGETLYKPSRGVFDVPVTSDVIGGNHISVVTPPAATPKNDIEYKRLAMEGARDGFYSRVTAYETYGILSPEDELELLRQEQSDPAFNPELLKLPTEPPGSPAAPNALVAGAPEDVAS